MTPSEDGPPRLDPSAFDLLFRDARTFSAWLPRPVDEAVLREVYAFASLGPTSTNCQPMRVVFVTTPDAKARLLPTLSEANVEKVRGAPVTAIFAYDLLFHDHLPVVFPHRETRSRFAGKDALIQSTAFRNATLQAAYFLMAARAFGLDCGPLSGFSNEAVDRAFFPGGTVRSNFLMNLGYGDRGSLFGRLPRLTFEETCSVL